MAMASNNNDNKSRNINNNNNNISGSGNGRIISNVGGSDTPTNHLVAAGSGNGAGDNQVCLHLSPSISLLSCFFI